ncbi:hypothetical protein PIB30_087769, partial [Stylosanthes scabra]|nr:hypothetical protein [Stylosanthes scabra]
MRLRVEPVDVTTAHSWLPRADSRGMGPATLSAASPTAPTPTACDLFFATFIHTNTLDK